MAARAGRSRYGWAGVLLAATLVGLGVPTFASAQPVVTVARPPSGTAVSGQDANAAGGGPRIGYGENGLEVRDPADRYRLVFGGRVQFRYASPYSDDPLDPEEIGRERETLTSIRRARFRVRGHAITPKLTFNVQYDLVNMWLLDARVDYEVRPWLQLRAGQWKADYNRERVASSSEQQMVERSIVNRVFTIDRQNGAMVLGRVRKDRPGDSNYWVGVFNGGGRSRGNDDRRPLWVARYQWNVAGGGVDMTGSDLDRTRTLRAIVAVAASGNQSAYTRFSSDGGGQIEDLPTGEPGEYRLAQWMGESALRWRGMSLQQEYHWKRVTNRTTGETLRLDGYYVQGGMFPHDFWRRAPRPLEFTARYATVDPNLGSPQDHREEVTVGANWFLRRHRNKFSIDASRLGFDTPAGFAETSTRVRLQWDVSF
jgi:hypothetical protein